jgi:TonB family protein
VSARNFRHGHFARWRQAAYAVASSLSVLAAVHAQDVDTRSPTPDAIRPSAAGTTAVPAGGGDTSATDAYSGFRREFDAGRYVEAVPLAQRVLNLTEQQAASPTGEDVQVALMNLGMVQNLAADYVGAESTYLRVIELAQSSGRPEFARLARAYAGLASAYHDGQRHDLAVKSFEQAIALTRRHEGLLTEQQVPLVQKYIDSLTQLQRYDEALQAQKYVLRIATRKYGADSVEITPTLEEIGRWYVAVGAYDQSRRILKQAIEIIERAEGPQSQRLTGPLLGLAACNRRQLLDPMLQQAIADADQASRFADPNAVTLPTGYTPGMLASEAERALLRAADITTAAAPAPAPLQVLTVQTQLGDWYQLRGQPERALPYYRQAWAAAVAVPGRLEGKPYSEAIFGQPTLLNVTRPENWNRYAYRTPDKIDLRTVVVEFTVTTDGRATAAKVIDDSGDARRADRTARALTETARYRPRFANGEPVATAGVLFNQPWYLPVQETEPAKAPPDQAAPAASAQPATQGG